MKNEYFSDLNFNKRWNEKDWEKFFKAQDAYHHAQKNKEIKRKPLPRIKFSGTDEVEAFCPILRAYGHHLESVKIPKLHNRKFRQDEFPEEEYYPSTRGNAHIWKEGVPLGTLLIYRDCCRFAIYTSAEIERYAKKRGKVYAKKKSSEFESLRFHANWIAINMAEGHQIGYSFDRINGNIAKCVRALKHANTCISLINRVSLQTKSSRLREHLFGFAFQLRNALLEWIDDLRLRYD